MTRLLSLLAFALVASLAVPANAQIEIDALFGGGADTDESDPNPFGIALGGDGYYGLTDRLHLGAEMLFYVGGTDESPGVDKTVRMLEFGPMIAYDVAKGPLIVRPIGGIGINLLFWDVDRNAGGPIVAVDTDGTDADFYWMFGTAVLYPIKSFMFGAQMRYTGVIQANNDDRLGNDHDVVSLDGFTWLAMFAIKLGSGGAASGDPEAGEVSAEASY